jgi:uncharacterized membrane protein YsdA (DUF1294 family)/cold shock CspA family protein
MRDEPFQKFQATSPQEGKISQWDDGKGCGWIRDGDKSVFVQIRDVERGQRRPRVGDEVRFMQGMDSKGRACAKRVALVKQGGRVGIVSWILLAALLVLPVLALAWLPVPRWWGIGLLAFASVITYGLYAHDKGRAIAAGWRVPEGTLHLAELLGGWPGAFLAQRRLRHKSSKSSYQVVFWCIVMLFQIVAVDVMLGLPLSRAVMEHLLDRG